MENKAGLGADWDEDEDGAGDGAGDDLEFGFYRGGAEEYDSDADEDDDDDDDEGDGIAGILKNPSALTDSRYSADFEQLERLGQGGFGTVYATASHLHTRIVTLPPGTKCAISWMVAFTLSSAFCCRRRTVH